MTALAITNTQVQPTVLVPNGNASGGGAITFGDVLDAVNPLQHIPLVSSLYRAVSGSQISTGSQLAGDALYGAALPGGIVANLASSAANAAVKAVTGKDIVGQIASAAGSLASSVSATFSGAAGSGSSSQTPTATPLVPAAASAAGSETAAAIAPVPLIRHPAHSPDHQYQRAAALDSINKRLLKMAV